MVTTPELEVDDVSLVRSNLLRIKFLMGGSRTQSDRSGGFATRILTRPTVPFWLAPTKTVMFAAETREGAKAATMANTEGAENFMVSNVKGL